MCTLFETIKEEGREEGRELGISEGKTESTLVSIRNLMKSMNLSDEQAMDALMIPAEEREKYIKLLSKETV